MKTIYEVRPLSKGKLNADLLDMLALHNSGKVRIDFDTLEAWIKADNGTTQRFEDVLMIAENGKHTLTIRELTFIGEVSNSEGDLINQQKLS